MMQKCSANYDISQSILYKLRSKKKLAEILGLPLNILQLCKSDSYYSCFDLEQKNKVRSIQQPIDQLIIIHQRVASLLSRLIHPDYLHSGRKKHSIITNASQHLDSNKKTLTLDIEIFFNQLLKIKYFNYLKESLSNLQM